MMHFPPEFLLLAAVVSVGVLHTIVPDHWVPITLLARQQGWTRSQTARAAVVAGTGHVVSTLLIGVVVWFTGVVVAARFGHLVSMLSSVALIGFGGWIALSSLSDLSFGHEHRHDHSHEIFPYSHDHDHPHNDLEDESPHGGTGVIVRHVHRHQHPTRIIHAHHHEHGPDTWHRVADLIDDEPPLHEHEHKTSRKNALLLILGSSPMIEGLPAFFAAAKFGPGLIAIMAAFFAASTIATYVVLCVYSTDRLQRVRFGQWERYGEVLSGAFIALVGFIFLIWPIL